MLENLTKIQLKNPVDLIISQIRELISSGKIKPGEKLPPERKLAEHFGVSRSQIREAINKLQFYGIVSVQPQSGTVVTGIGTNALEGYINNILKIEKQDFLSLVQARIVLEKEAARLAAINRTEENIAEIKHAAKQYQEKLQNGMSAIEEDLMFHVKIVEASGNSVLKSMMITITPNIVKSFVNLKVCHERSNENTINQHDDIINMIEEKNPEGAVKAMERHLNDVLEFSKNYSNYD